MKKIIQNGETVQDKYSRLKSALNEAYAAALEQAPEILGQLQQLKLTVAVYDNPECPTCGAFFNGAIKENGLCSCCGYQTERSDWEGAR